LVAFTALFFEHLLVLLSPKVIATSGIQQSVESGDLIRANTLKETLDKSVCGCAEHGQSCAEPGCSLLDQIIPCIVRTIIESAMPTQTDLVQ
jgi:hypothetical protein